MKKERLFGYTGGFPRCDVVIVRIKVQGPTLKLATRMGGLNIGSVKVRKGNLQAINRPKFGVCVLKL